MKKFTLLICAAITSISTMAYAGPTTRSFSLESTDPISDIFIGDSIGWEVRVREDHRMVTITRGARYAAPTDLLFVTPGGLAAYDIANDGRPTPNEDRRILRSGDALELAPLHVSVLELPGEVTRVEWTRPLSLQIMTVVDHRYVALKYVPLDHLKIQGPRRLTIATNSGKYTFDMTTSPGGAPIYRVVDGN